MKMRILSCLALSISLPGYGQNYCPGSVDFRNYFGPGIDTAVYFSDRLTRVSGPQYTVALLAGPTESGITLQATTSFLDMTGAEGYFLGPSVLLTNVCAFNIAWYQIQAWDTTLGGTTTGATWAQAIAYGQTHQNIYGSVMVRDNVGCPYCEPPGLPTVLTGLTSFDLNAVPVPLQIVDDFYYGINQGAVTLTAYDGPGGAVAAPATINNLPVTAVDKYTFYGASTLNSLTLPNSITNIGDYAFGYCPNLVNLFFTGNSPTNVGFGVFSGDANATVYYLPGTSGWGATFQGQPALLWNPVLQHPRVQNGEFGFDIAGTTNIPIVLETSPTLLTSTWSVVQACSLTNGALFLSDPTWTNYTQRFYRIRSP